MAGRLYPQPVLYLLRWRVEMTTGQEMWASPEGARHSQAEIIGLFAAAGDKPAYVRIYGMMQSGMLVTLEDLERRAPRSVFTGFDTQLVH